MNILVAVDNFFPDRMSGSARVAWDIAQVARDAGHDVVVVCYTWPGDRTPEPLAEEQGVRVLRCRRPSLPSWHPRKVARTIQTVANTVSRHLGQERFDVIHTHTPYPGLGALRALGNGPRCVATVHSPILLEQEINWGGQGLIGRAKLLLARRGILGIERKLLSRADAIHTLSRFTRDQLERFHGMGDRVTVIPHWRREELTRRHSREEAKRLLGWPEDRPTFFTLRRHVERMGLDTAINAIAPLAVEGRCYLVLAGDGRLRPRLEQMARRMGATAEQVAFPGRVSEEDLHLSYEAADVFVLPTRALECFGLITQEAMAYGCPVLASTAGATPEQVTPILPDYLFDPDDAKTLAEKAEMFIDGRLPAPPPETLTAYVEAHFSREAVCPRLLKLLEGGCHVPQTPSA